MKYTVYMILSKINNKFISYVGYTNNIKKRLILHNSSKGAKFTKGKKWKLIYSKTYYDKSEAMKEEFKLKKNYTKRGFIKKRFIIKNEIN
jgi:putative endonuclease